MEAPARHATGAGTSFAARAMALPVERRRSDGVKGFARKMAPGTSFNQLASGA